MVAVSINADDPHNKDVPLGREAGPMAARDSTTDVVAAGAADRYHIIKT